MTSIYLFILFISLTNGKVYLHEKQKAKKNWGRKAHHGPSAISTHTKTETMAKGAHTYAEFGSAEWNAIQKSLQFAKIAENGWEKNPSERINELVLPNKQQNQIEPTATKTKTILAALDEIESVREGE